MNNKAHLRPKDYDSNGDIIPMACKECIIGYTIKCESGEEYIACDSIQKFQQEVKND